MPITSEISGDLLELAFNGRYNAIAHGCNCFVKMGAGIAPAIANAFEGVREADKNYPAPGGSKDRLGNFSLAVDVIDTTLDDGRQEPKILHVYNLYTQYGTWGRWEGKMDVDYDALEQCFEKLNTEIPPYAKLGIPMIGAGLAGGDWEEIKKRINRATPDIEIELVIFNPKA